MQELVEKSQEVESKQNRIIDLKNRVLNKITTKFKKLVEDIEAATEKERAEESANIMKVWQLALDDANKQLRQEIDNSNAKCKEMAQMKQAEHDQEAIQEFNTLKAALKAALAPGELLHYCSKGIRARKQAELDAFRAAQEAQLSKIKSDIIDKTAKSFEIQKAKADQLKGKVNARNKILNIMDQEYDKKIHEFVENTSVCIAENFDDNFNVERVIEQEVDIFLQSAAVDLYTAVDLSTIYLTI